MFISSACFGGVFSTIKAKLGHFKYSPARTNISLSKRSHRYKTTNHGTHKHKTVSLICFGEGAQEYSNFLDTFIHEFQQQAPNDFEVRTWPGDKDGTPVDLSSPSILKLLHDVQLAVVWSPPLGLFKLCPQLRLISILGAGVDPMMAPPLVNTLPPSVPITRLVDPIAAQRISIYVLNAVLNITLQTDILMEQQKKKVWDHSLLEERKDVNDITVGIMGLGAMGSQTANLLKSNGFQVIGWKRKKTPSTTVTDDVKQFYGKSELPEFLRNSNILVCLLPLTPETTGIINSGFLEQLPKGASVINCARGSHVVEDDLIHALDMGIIRRAFLDVFVMEPLPFDSPLWTHPKITITPHIAGWSAPKSGVRVILDNWNRLKEGKPLQGLVDVNAKY